MGLRSWRLLMGCRLWHAPPAAQEDDPLIVAHTTARHAHGASPRHELQVQADGDVGKVPAGCRHACLCSSSEVADVQHTSTAVKEVLRGSAQSRLRRPLAAAIARGTRLRFDNHGRR